MGFRTPNNLRVASFFILAILTRILVLSLVKGECSFPSEWSGKWFQGGRGALGLVAVNSTHFSNGACVEEGKASRYFVYDSHEQCYKCVVVHMKHENVIHYKESYCDSSIRDMRSACDTITGDNRLYWMFRWNADVVPCPFKGPLTYTYSKGWGKECKNPVSQVDSCADDMRLYFRQQACPDVPNSQSKEEELVCLGSWKDGSDHYFVGKLNHSHAYTDEDRYRCFMYEKARRFRKYSPDEPGTMWRLTMSNDAACQSLNSVTDAAKIMKLKKANNGKKCKFPSWLTGKSHWRTLDLSQSYFFYHHNTSLKISNGTSAPEDFEVRGQTDLRLICHNYVDYIGYNKAFTTPIIEPRGHHLRALHDSSDDVIIIVHFTVGCRSGYRCMKAFRRKDNVVQVQFGNDALTSEEACSSFYWDPVNSDPITLVSHGRNEKDSCGAVGKYTVLTPSECTLNPSNAFTALSVGCSHHNTLQLHHKCSQSTISSYKCHGQWKANGFTYVVASPTRGAKGTPGRVCFVYHHDHQSSSDEIRHPSKITLSARHDTCIPRTSDAHFHLNATLIDNCAKASGISSGTSQMVAINTQRIALWTSVGSLLLRTLSRPVLSI